MKARRVLQLASLIALIGTVLPSILFLTGTMELGPMKSVMLAATVLWFVVTPLWMGRASPADGADAV